MKLNSIELKGHGAMLVASMMWGLMSPISKTIMASGTISSLLLTNFRIIGAAIAFWIASAFVKKEHVPHEDMLKLFFAAMLAIILNQGTFIMGVSLTSPIDASIVTTTLPMIVMIISAFYLREPITGLKVLGLLAGSAGALLLILSSTSAINSTNQSGNIWGDLLCLLAQCSYATYFVLFKGLIGRYSPFTLMKWMFTYATIVIVPFSYHELSTLNPSQLTPNEIGGSLFVVLGATFFAYLLIPIGQHALRPTVACMYNYVQPIVASIVAIALGMDHFGFQKSIAVVLVFLGVYIVTQSKSRVQMENHVKEQNSYKTDLNN